MLLPRRLAMVFLAAAAAIASPPTFAEAQPRWLLAAPSSTTSRESLTVVEAGSAGILLATSDIDLDRQSQGRARLIALDGQGAVQWRAAPGPGSPLSVLAVQPCGGGAVFLAASYDDTPSILVVGAVAADGAIRWRRELGERSVAQVVPDAYAIAATADCGVAVARAIGRSDAGASPADRSVHLARLAAADGTPIWSRRLRGIPDLAGHAFAPVIAAGDGGVHVAGRRLADGRAVVVRLADEDGAVDWVSTGFDAGASFPGGMALAVRGGRVVAAGWSTQAPPGAGQAVAAVALDADDGSLQWSRSLAPAADSLSGVVALDLSDVATLRFGDDIARLALASGDLSWQWNGRALKAHAVGADGSVAVAFSPVFADPSRVQRLAAADGGVTWDRGAGELGLVPVRLAVAPGTGHVALLAATQGESSLDGIVFSDDFLLLDRDDGDVLRRGPLPIEMAEPIIGAAAVGADAVVVGSVETDAVGATTLVVERRASSDGGIAWRTRVPIDVPGAGLSGYDQPLVMDGLVALAVIVGPQVAHLASSQLVVLDATNGSVVSQHRRSASVDGSTSTGWSLLPVALRRGDGVSFVEIAADYTPSTGTISRTLIQHARFAGGGWSDPLAGPTITTGYATPGGVLVVDYGTGGELSLRLLDAADGQVAWQAVVPDGRDWFRGATVAGDVAYLWGERNVAVVPAPDSRMVIEAYALADGIRRWRVEHDSVTVVPDSPIEVRAIAGGDLLASLLHRGRAPGQSVWRIRAGDGGLAWRRELPVMGGFGRSSGGIVELPDGRVAATTTLFGGGSAFDAAVLAHYLVALEPSDGMVAGWHALSAAQRMAVGPDRQPFAWIASAAGPLALATDWLAGQPSTQKLIAFEPPPLVQGDLSLRTISFSRDASGSGRLDVVVEASYQGGRAAVDAVLRVGTPAGAALLSIECDARPPSTCSEALTQPQGRQAVTLVAGGSATFAFSVQALAWPAAVDQVFAVLAGDFRIAEGDVADHTAMWPVANLPLRDSFE